MNEEKIKKLKKLVNLYREVYAETLWDAQVLFSEKNGKSYSLCKENENNLDKIEKLENELLEDELKGEKNGK